MYTPDIETKTNSLKPANDAEKRTTKRSDYKRYKMFLIRKLFT